MKSIIIGIDPGTKAAGIAVMLDEGNGRGYWPQLIRTVRYDREGFDMVQALLDVVRGHIDYRFRDHRVLCVIEDYVERHGNSKSARVLEVIGALKFIMKQHGCPVKMVSHAAWRGEWTNFTMRCLARGENVPEWIARLGEHEQDAAKMAWLEVEKQSTAPAEPGKKE